MRKRRGVRAIVASMFVIGSAAVGVGITAGPLGAGAPVPPNGEPNGDGIPCRVEDDNSNGGNNTAIIIEPRDRQCAQLEVTKVVTGTPAPSPPPGTTFAVVVDCVPTEDNNMEPAPRDLEAQSPQDLPQGQTPPFTTTLTFPEGGGTQSVFITRPSDCTVSETPPPGCTLTSIDPVTTHITDPILYPVTVTNNCDPAPEPAVAVVQAPRFTG